MKKHTTSEFENEWALQNGKRLHISQADKGKRNYFCIGCKKEMVAVVEFKNIGHQKYFRHHVNPDTQMEPCTFNAKQYRERIAKVILRRTKKIKVPAVYKYPPKGEEGEPVFLKKSQIIEAKRVLTEVQFFEDENGEIKNGAKTGSEEKNNLIRPDVVFYNSRNEPILFIELIVTHPIDDEKLPKIIRMGINTLAVYIPRGTDKEIEESLTTVSNKKWVYHHEEFNTDYFSISKRGTSRVQPIDEDQGRIYEEKYRCRKIRIENLIRTATKINRAERFKNAVGSITREIDRIEQIISRERQELERLEEGEEKGIREKYSGALEAERNAIEEEQEENTRIEGERKRIEDATRPIVSQLQQISGIKDIARLPERGKSLSGDIEREKANIERERAAIGILQSNIEGIENDERICGDEEEEIDFYFAEINRIKKRIESAATADSGR
ncbi:MAG TPA: hypothetical protein VFM70_07065 [Salinimicrobium sp.]|nr:hypothetical protein [Salinimicrobium sp.]